MDFKIYTKVGLLILYAMSGFETHVNMKVLTSRSIYWARTFLPPNALNSTAVAP
jgi:hypothetical protein